MSKRKSKYYSSEELAADSWYLHRQTQIRNINEDLAYMIAEEQKLKIMSPKERENYRKKQAEENKKFQRSLKKMMDSFPKYPVSFERDISTEKGYK